MKQFILLFFTVLSASSVFAQDYNQVVLNYQLGKIDKAKTELEKLELNPKAKDKVETVLWQLVINSEIYADSALYIKYPDAEKNALAAFEKYSKAEPALTKLKDAASGGVRAVGLLYSQSFNIGKENFIKNDWNKSFTYFAIAEKVGEFINNNGLNENKIAIDTVTVLYTAYAAQNATLYAEATTYYQKLTDLKISGADYEDIYRFLIDYYSKQKDQANFAKYLALAKELYPNDNAMWAQLEMNNMTENTGLSEILDAYRKELSGGTMNEDKYLNYAETFATAKHEDLEKLDSAKQQEIKLAGAEAFSKAFEFGQNGLYAFNAGVINYSVFGVLDERYLAYRGEAAALKAKRAEIEKEQYKYADESIKWLEQAYTILKAKQDRVKSETSSLNRAVDYLANLYIWKRDKSKVTTPKDYDIYDAKFKQFDLEHNSFK